MQDPWLERWRGPLADRPDALAALMRLRWAVGSAPLMARHPDLRFQVLDDAWFADALEADLPLFDDWAARLVMGEDPLPPGVLDAQSQLLGKHFEALIAAWLDASPHFRLLAHGVQLQQDKQTVGELDFLVDDLRRGRLREITEGRWCAGLASSTVAHHDSRARCRKQCTSLAVALGVGNAQRPSLYMWDKRHSLSAAC